MAPSGFVAGVYAATDASRGVWKAPAGLAPICAQHHRPGASGVMNDPQQGVLNLNSINCLRSFSGVGTVVWGSRTLVAGNSAYQQSDVCAGAADDPVHRADAAGQSALGGVRAERRAVVDRDQQLDLGLPAVAVPPGRAAGLDARPRRFR